MNIFEYFSPNRKKNEFELKRLNDGFRKLGAINVNLNRNIQRLESIKLNLERRIQRQCSEICVLKGVTGRKL